MNGRCDNDPLDPADNVCDLCGGEFCDTCLITPRGRKKPWCKKCALDHSGVRGGVKTQKKSGKRDARKRRQEIIESRDEHEGGKFIFFDDEESDFELREPVVAETEPETKKGNRRKVSLGILKNKSEDSDTDTDDETPKLVVSDAPPPASDEPTAMDAPPPTAADAITEEPTSIELLSRLQDHLPTGMLDEAAKPGAFDFAEAPSAASMPALDDAFDPTFDPFAIADVGGPEPEDGFEEPAPPISFDDGPQPFESEQFSPEEDFAPEGSPFGAQSFEPVTASPRPSLVDRLSDDAPVGPISEAEFLGETDQWVAPETSAIDEAAVENSVKAAAEEDAELLAPAALGGQASSDEFVPSGGDDTDDTGNWIPPSLRGMAPIEERESLSLPKRGQG